MPLYITALNSGSNGNCYYIGNETEAVLIDAGISCRETEKRMKKLGLSLEIVKAIFVSHEHSDHITGIPGISKKHQIPVYITEKTLAAAKIPIEAGLIRSFNAHLPIAIGDLKITAFPKYHDAIDPHSFIVSSKNSTVGIFTDIGTICKQLIRYFQKCDAAFLESNYCDDMLANGSYPEYLKKRISGENGHLSNAQALELFLNHKKENLTHLILSHLSKNNNSMKLVEELFLKQSGKVKITVASRYKETDVFAIGRTEKELNINNKNKINKHQLSLFN